MSVEIIKNFATQDACKKIYKNSLIELENNFGSARGYRESYSNLPVAEDISDNDVSDIFNGSFLTNNGKNIIVIKEISKLLFGIQRKIENFYGVKISEVQSSLIKMLEGAKNDLHSDMYLLDGGEWHGGYGNRSAFEYSALLYLSTYNKDFGGGEIVFPSLEVTYKPELGGLVFFSGDLDHKHFVREVTFGERLCLVVFLKPDKS